MDGFILLTVITIALIVLGAAAAAFGTDSRDGFAGDPFRQVYG